MTKSELSAFLRPHISVSSAVLSWLSLEGVSQDEIEDSGDWITFFATVGHADKMLDTKFHYFHNSHSSTIRTTEYSLPKEIRKHIQLIQPTTRFGDVRA